MDLRILDEVAYSAEGFRAWQRAAGGAESGAGAAGGSGLPWCLNPQGSSGISVTEERTDTLVAQDHGHHPAVLQSAGFCTEHSANAHSIGYKEEMAPTLRASQVPEAMALQNNPTDARLRIAGDGVVQTLTGRMGTGGNNTPLVAEPVTLKIRSGKPGGGKGALVQTDMSATLATGNDQTLFQPTQPAYGISKEAYHGGERANYNFAVSEEVASTLQRAEAGAVAKPEPGCLAFGVCSKASKGMLSDNPHVGFYKAETSRTLDRGGGNPTCNQGGIAVVERPPAFSATVGSFMSASEETAQTLMARDWKDPQIVNAPSPDEPTYIVRRLMPVECARLQGFPDWWCDGLETPEPTEEEIAFWSDVFETHRRVTRPDGKPKSRSQIIRWLRNPRTDSAEYAMWGNGCALPCVFFVMAGIAWADGLDSSGTL